jgi:Na+/H+ antiporter NhaD/arsenite permease-like protein
MDSQIILSSVAKDVCYTAAEWAALAAQVNSDMYTALWTGLVIGAVVGAAGLYLGLWYNGKNRK